MICTLDTQLNTDHRLCLNGISSFFCLQQEPGFCCPGESHDLPELLYMIEGRLHSVALGQETLLQPGDLVIYDAGEFHMQYTDMAENTRFVSLQLDVSGGDLKSLARRKFLLSPQQQALMRQLLEETQSSDPYAGDMILSLLQLLLLQLLRQSQQLESPAVSHENQIICRTQQFICGHLRQKLSVPLVAQRVNVSPSYLTALFHKHLRLSPGEYIRRLKLEESKHLIREGQLNFTQISAALNYSTVHHFSRQFKENFGLTPSEYARCVR